MAGASKQETEKKDVSSFAIQTQASMYDIIISTVKRVSLVGFVYFAGYMNWSIAWMIGPIIMLVMRDQWRKESKNRRNMAQAVALSDEKTVIQARLNDLPAWVFFPDIERTEWLNRIIKQCWPNVNKHAYSIMKKSIEPAIKSSLEKYKMNNFCFDRIILGEIPFRIGGVKVYEKHISRNEIIMDLDIYYAGNCDITFTLSGVKGGIRDFQLHGMLRVVMKPLIDTIPLIGGLQVFFLNNPTIDFDLVGIVDILDLPGLSDILRRCVVEQIASMMVLPNKFPIQLSDSVEVEILKRPEPEGVLRVHVIEAKELMKMDYGVLGKGKSDPYAVLKVGAQEFQTKTIMNTVTPKWDYWCEFVVSEASGQSCFLHLWDKDDAKDDEMLGRATIEIANVAKKGHEDLWITLEKAKHGMVHLRLTWLKLSSDYNDLKAALAETQSLRITDMHTAILSLYVDSAKMLPEKRASSKPDPYLTIRCGKYTQQTGVVMRTTDPVWQQGFTFLVANPETDSLYFNVCDQKTGGDMGELVYQLTTLSQKVNLEVPQQPFGLKKGGPESKLLMSLQMRILKNDLPQEEDTPVEQESPLIRQGSTHSSTSSIVPPSPIKKSLISREASIASTGTASQVSGVDATLVEEVATEELVSLMSSTPPGSTLLHRTPSTTSSSGDHGLGRIQLTLRYSVNRQRLIIVIHKIANIPLKDPSNIPDPYVKLYLLPDRLKDTKRKTKVVKDNCNPVFDEQFEYLISRGDLVAHQLEVTVCTQKQLFSGSNVLGQIVLDLPDRLTHPVNSWYDLQPENL